MLTATTRAVSSSLLDCELSFIPRNAINLEKARAQHLAYEQLLEKLGARVISLPEEKDLSDSMFVEDPAIVLDEIAVIFPLGTESRRKEAPSIAAVLEKYRKLAYVKLPGTVEGGDVLQIGKKVFVGITRRSNPEGIRQLAVILAAYGYEVIAIQVGGCLHLKSAVTYVGNNTLLANRNWFKAERFAGFDHKGRVHPDTGRGQVHVLRFRRGLRRRKRSRGLTRTTTTAYAAVGHGHDFRAGFVRSY